jgi:hypothetical protein
VLPEGHVGAAYRRRRRSALAAPAEERAVAVGLDEAVRGSDAHERDGGAHDEDPPGIHVVRVRVRVRARVRARGRARAPV